VLNDAQPDVIFHLAGYSSVKGSFDEPALTFQANCRGMENLLEAVRKVCPGSKFVFVGSSEEYGLQICSESHYRWALETYKTVSPLPFQIPELPVSELNPLRPLSPYAVSKVYGDYLTRTYWASYGLNAVVARAFNHEGAGRGQNYVTSSIIRQCIQLSEGSIDCIRIGNVGAFRDWSHVEDIVEGYRLLAEKGCSGEVYVLGSRRMNSVLTYLLLGLSEVGYSIDALETLKGEKRVEGPMEPDPDPMWGLVFDKPCIDGQLLSNGLAYNLADEGLRIFTPQGEVKIVFDPNLFRPADIPLMISNPARAENLGYRIKHSLRDIVRDQVRSLFPAKTGQAG
jgi:GDPmannose 4,6-dehydratase